VAADTETEAAEKASATAAAENPENQ